MLEGRLCKSVSEVAAHLGNAADAPAVVDVLTRFGLTAGGGERAVLCLVDHENARLVPIDAENVPNDEVNRILEEVSLDHDTPMTVATRTGMPVWVRSLDQARARYPRFADLAESLDQGACCALPMLHGTTGYAVLGVMFPDAQDFSEAERLFFVTIANMAGLALSGQLSRGVTPGVPTAVPARDRDVRRVTLCAWTRLAEVDGVWMSIDDYLTQRLGIDVTHGIHPDVTADVIKSNEVSVRIPVLPLLVEPIDTTPEPTIN